MCIRDRSTLRAFAGTQAAEWVEKHCGDFGFIVRYPEGEEEITGYEYEPWHITYVGVETAADKMCIRDSILCRQAYNNEESFVERRGWYVQDGCSF